jgi:class 3 adenylate cyclase/tetratricopeptide (TPR) repeat protein
VNCPSCGNEVPEAARFCPSCGHTLVSRPDERRVATVVFADLVGFTTFSESADPERVKNLVDRCFERLAVDVNDYGGQVDKIMGDALVALFGAPVAHEDDAERAVRAALQMQRTLAELRELHQIGAEMRVGVNTGEVLVGALAAGGDYTAMGDVVNTAGRLQTAARPGKVLVGPATYEATRNGVRYEALGPLAIKGRDEPVEAWVALEPVAPPGQRPTRAHSPLVGREAEVDMVRTVLRTTVERRRAHLVLLAGEAGVGKTRLARELGSIAREEYGAMVMLGHCAPYGEANIWFPIAEALRKACVIDASDSADAVRRKCSEAAAAATGLAEGSAELSRIGEGLLYFLGQGGAEDVDPARARDDALRSLHAFLEGLANQRPVVLALSDLHWADDLVLDLVDRLMARFRTLPFLLAATTRPELDARWHPRPGPHNALLVNLEPLDHETGTTLARALLGPDADDDEVADVVERSGGNPFFIEELATVFAESGEVPAQGNGHLPGTLRGLIAARIDTLDRAERATLEDCAVIGAGGSIELVTALAAARGDDRPRLDALVDKSLLELQRNEYIFKTALIRDVAYNILTKAERARRHSTLSQLLAKHATKTGRFEEVLDELAHHYGAAAALLGELGTVEGVPNDLSERAVEFLEHAAERAAQQETWMATRRLLGMALGVLGDADPDRRLRLLLRRARALVELRELARARRDLNDAMARAESQGDDRAIATATSIRGDLELKENDVAASMATLAQAVQRWRELEDPAGLADALRLQGMTEMFRGELDAADEAISEALECFRSVADRRGEAASLQNLAWIAFYRGHLDVAEARLNESTTAFAEIGDWGGLGWALGLMAWVRFNQGDLEEAEKIARDVLREASDVGNRWASGIMQVLLANVGLWRGQTTDAVEQAEAARTVFCELEDAWGELQALAPMARALACLGRGGEARDALDAMAAAVTRMPDNAIRQFPAVVRANIAVHSGAADARDAAEQIVVLTEADGLAFEQRTIRGLAALQAGEVAEAIATLEQTRMATNTRGPGAAAGAALALAYGADGRASDAVALCAEIADAAVTYLDHLQLALARGFALVQQGDLPGAEQAFWRALEIADRSDSRLDQAVARLARARAWEAMARPDADEASREAAARLDALDLQSPGWDNVFKLAASAGTS